MFLKLKYFILFTDQKPASTHLVSFNYLLIMNITSTICHNQLKDINGKICYYELVDINSAICFHHLADLNDEEAETGK